MFRDRRNNNQKKIVFFGVIAFVAIFMSIGYSLLSEELKLDATANLYASRNFLWYKLINDFAPVDLVQTQYESGKYSYIGSSPDNYIQLDGSLWRIISVESDHTLKIIKNDVISSKYDDSNNRTSSSTYCLDLQNGCNSWDLAGTLTNSTITGSVENTSTINDYLNTTFYNNLSNDFKSKIEPHFFNIGAIEDNSTFSSILTQEESNYWEGNVGLPLLSDFLYSQSGSTSTSLSSAGNSYLYDYASQKILWTMNPLSDDSSKVWTITQDKLHEAKYVNNSSEEINSVTYTYTAHPTLYLKSTVKFSSGTGTISDPFILE